MAAHPDAAPARPAIAKPVSGPPAYCSPIVEPEINGPIAVAKCETAVFTFMNAPRSVGSEARNIIVWAGIIRPLASTIKQLVDIAAVKTGTDGRLVITIVMTMAPPAQNRKTVLAPILSVAQPTTFIETRVHIPANE